MKSFKKLSLLIVIIILAAGGMLAWWLRGTLPVNANDQAKRNFVIEKGESVREIANRLKSEQLIRDPVLFFILVKRLGIDEKIQAGNFTLSPSMNALEIANALKVGTFDSQFVIPEGKRAQEIADILSRGLLSYQDNWRGELIQNEGYLFPDTYSFPKDATIDQVIQSMRDNFNKKYNSISPNNQSQLSKEQIIIIASLVEREAKHDVDRPLVASVILNRLQNGMPLQIDATVQYILGYQPVEKTWWKKDLTYEDLKINSPYNTYLKTGLPPGPIANPGKEALDAVINVPSTEYLFYISDSSGNNHYAKTNAEHEANKTKYGL